ncbi:MAG TPA: gluconeogenesis factor YvcK family protein [Candidatus Saccharimonadales bacterium]|nr:gluconeogenesis factor YvcK family protein [Candidatus Saccharimonadales bacterium]
MQKVGMKVVVIGGGTGSFAVLSGLKNYCRDITALVSMVDDGGSTGELRDELGVLPPGDVRQCLVALSEDPSVTRELFNYRFEDGKLSGHSFGNLFLTALEKVTGNFAEAVETASEVLKISGRVLPMTLDNVHLAVKLDDGTLVKGEHAVDTTDLRRFAPNPWLILEPNAVINPDADKAIREADLVVIAPGDLYTSVGAALIIKGVNQALEETKAKVVYVCNLVTKPGQTTGMGVYEHASEIERFCGRNLDFVLYNTSKPDENVFEKYEREGELLITPPAKTQKTNYLVKGSDLIFKGDIKLKKGDRLAKTRSFIRHDPDRVARALMKIYFS